MNPKPLKSTSWDIQKAPKINLLVPRSKEITLGRQSGLKMVQHLFQGTLLEAKSSKVLRLPAKSNPAEFFYMQKALKYRACQQNRTPAEFFYKQKALKYRACQQNRAPRNSRDTATVGHGWPRLAAVGRGWPRLATETTHQVLLRAPFLHAPGARMTAVELTPSNYDPNAYSGSYSI